MSRTAVKVPTRYCGYTLVVSDTDVRVVKNGRTLGSVASVPSARRFVRTHRKTERQEATP
jgi:hypothetical protein